VICPKSYNLIQSLARIFQTAIDRTSPAISRVQISTISKSVSFVNSLYKPPSPSTCGVQGMSSLVIVDSKATVPFAVPPASPDASTWPCATHLFEPRGS
jgi:hypothetical protein